MQFTPKLFFFLVESNVLDKMKNLQVPYVYCWCHKISLDSDSLVEITTTIFTKIKAIDTKSKLVHENTIRSKTKSIAVSLDTRGFAALTFGSN